MTEVVGAAEFEAWFLDLETKDAEAVARGRAARRTGPLRGHPYSSAVRGARFALRELRVQARGRPLRVFYAFDPERRAALLIGGDKTGNERFYAEMIPVAERIWQAYLREEGR